MVFCLPVPVARLLPLFALLLAAPLAYFSIRSVRAARTSELNTRDGLERAVQLEPENARYWFLLGRFYQNDFAQGDLHAARKALLTARTLEPLSANTLLELAINSQALGKTEEARAAFIDAIGVAPQSAEVRWRYGNFLLGQNEIPAAFLQINKALQLDPKRSSEAFSRCYRATGNAEKVFNEAIPPNLRSYLDIILDQVKENQLDLALAAWSRAYSLPGTIHLDEVGFLAKFLLEAKRFDDAFLLWKQATEKAALRIPLDPAGSVLWDGGFEFGHPLQGLGWSYEPQLRGVHVDLDKTEKHSGTQSLRVGFGSRTNIAFADACHLGVAEAGKFYRFSAWIKTKGVTTNEGVRFIIASQSQTNTMRTEDVRGNQPWTEVSLMWFQPADSRQVSVCVARQQSDLPDGAISGTAWIDDVSLVPVKEERGKP